MSSAESAHAEPQAAPLRLRECTDCGLILHLPPLPRSAVARCPRCDAVLRRRRSDSAVRALAFAAAGLILFAIALVEPFMNVEVRGLGSSLSLARGPLVLEEYGYWPLAAVVLVTTLAAPCARLAALAYVLAALQLDRPPQHLYAVFRWTEWLGPWAMAEVFLLGAFVAYTRLTEIAQVDIGVAVYALGGLALANAAADTLLDKEAVWQGLEHKGIVADHADAEGSGPLAGCDSCGLVSRAVSHCPRCGAHRRRRKPNSASRTWALLLAAGILYIPANLLPVMNVMSLGRGTSATIMGGVVELAGADMWPLAALVFFASITVPLLKLAGLTWLLLSIRTRTVRGLRRRTWLYRIVDHVGRWSMIDVFMVSILTALVRLGVLATITPGPAAVAFGAVVVLTMFAAGTFDPRLMWDAAGQNRA
jgi:paraquat-inducible protein A